MAVEIARKLFTIDEYEQMIEAGILKKEDRVELIEGEILEMAPIHLPHEVCVTRLTLLFIQRLGTKVVVWPQNSIRLPTRSRPQPDVTLLKWRDDLYLGKAPLPEDVLLLVEVSDTSLRYDRGKKLRLYAQAGILEVWIVNLVESVLEVYSDPAGDVYEARRFGRGDRVPLPGELGGVGAIEVGDILG